MGGDLLESSTQGTAVRRRTDGRRAAIDEASRASGLGAVRSALVDDLGVDDLVVGPGRPTAAGTEEPAAATTAEEAATGGALGPDRRIGLPGLPPGEHQGAERDHVEDAELQTQECHPEPEHQRRVGEDATSVRPGRERERHARCEQGDRQQGEHARSVDLEDAGVDLGERAVVAVLVLLGRVGGVPADGLGAAAVELDLLVVGVDAVDDVPTVELAVPALDRPGSGDGQDEDRDGDGEAERDQHRPPAGYGDDPADPGGVRVDLDGCRARRGGLRRPRGLRPAGGARRARR